MSSWCWIFAGPIWHKIMREVHFDCRLAEQCEYLSTIQPVPTRWRNWTNACTQTQVLQIRIWRDEKFEKRTLELSECLSPITLPKYWGVGFKLMNIECAIWMSTRRWGERGMGLAIWSLKCTGERKKDRRWSAQNEWVTSAWSGEDTFYYIPLMSLVPRFNWFLDHGWWSFDSFWRKLWVHTGTCGADLRIVYWPKGFLRRGWFVFQGLQNRADFRMPRVIEFVLVFHIVMRMSEYQLINSAHSLTHEI